MKFVAIGSVLKNANLKISSFYTIAGNAYCQTQMSCSREQITC